MGANPVTTTNKEVITANQNLFVQMQDMLKLAEVMAKSKVTVPTHLQGNTGDCLAVITQSIQWDMNPFAVAQKTHLIQGRLGYEAQLVAAVVNCRAPVKHSLNYEYFGDWTKIIGNTKEVPTKNGGTMRKLASTVEDEKSVGVRVTATLKGETAPRVTELLLAQVITRNSTMWAEDPKQQLSYLAAKKWSRLHTPEVILGVYTPDELETVVAAKETITDVIEKALNQVGLAIKIDDGKAIVVGNTIQHAALLQKLGFEYENKKWFMLATDYVEAEIDDDKKEEVAKPAEPLPKFNTIEELELAVANYGLELHVAPGNGGKDTWATVKGNTDGLEKVLLDGGFVNKKGILVMNVTELVAKEGESYF